MRLIIILLSITLLSSCADTSGYNYYSSSSNYCDSDCQKQKCKTAKENKSKEMLKANETSFAKYKAGETDRNCPDPSYLGSFYVSACNDTVSFNELFSCSYKIDELTKYTKIINWDEKACAFRCENKCIDKSKCGSTFEKTSGWLGDLFDGDNSKKKKKDKKREIPKTITTTCKWDFLGSWVCKSR